MEAISKANNQKLVLAKGIVYAFFDRNYPSLDKDQFWRWLMLTLTGGNRDIQNMSENEVEKLLSVLNEIGGVIFEKLDGNHPDGMSVDEKLYPLKPKNPT